MLLDDGADVTFKCMTLHIPIRIHIVRHIRMRQYKITLSVMVNPKTSADIKLKFKFK